MPPLAFRCIPVKFQLCPAPAAAEQTAAVTVEKED